MTERLFAIPLDETQHALHRLTSLLDANSYHSFWNGIATIYNNRNDLPDGAWDEVKEILPRNDQDKISRAMTRLYTSEDFNELMYEVQGILEDWGLLSPWSSVLQ